MEMPPRAMRWSCDECDYDCCCACAHVLSTRITQKVRPTPARGEPEPQQQEELPTILPASHSTGSISTHTNASIVSPLGAHQTLPLFPSPLQTNFTYATFHATISLQASMPSAGTGAAQPDSVPPALHGASTAHPDGSGPQSFEAWFGFQPGVPPPPSAAASAEAHSASAATMSGAYSLPPARPLPLSEEETVAAVGRRVSVWCDAASALGGARAGSRVGQGGGWGWGWGSGWR